ncbi:hypothetical protein CLF_103392 [Clonorchis sinensis]|uniref:Peptidase A2 domain-containing protein n=1 Tax=Clonorchis sinensis TaxID=79923 RepID=H2KQ82_CLOSI|nr:hypothetical protein CLF_103392 [Clonorchis sinensis]
MTATFRMKSPGRRKFITMCINGTLVTLQLDTALDLTLLSKRTCGEIGRPPVEQTKCIVPAAPGGSLKLIGKLNCSVKFEGIQLNGNCRLTNYTGLNLLGVDWTYALQLLYQLLNAVCSETAADGCNKSTRAPPPDYVVVGTVTAKPETTQRLFKSWSPAPVALSLQSILVNPARSLERFARSPNPSVYSPLFTRIKRRRALIIQNSSQSVSRIFTSALLAPSRRF